MLRLRERKDEKRLKIGLILLTRGIIVVCARLLFHSIENNNVYCML